MKLSRWISHPWFFFLLLILTNSCLSYVPISLLDKFWIFLIVFLPINISIFYFWERWSETTPPFDRETLPPIRPWLFIALLILAIYLRFFRLDSFSTWPNVDEGRTSIFAIEQAHHWEWKLLYGYNQLPPFYYWLFALFYKIIQPSLFSLWLFPALLSTVILFLGSEICRFYFSKSFSLLATGLLAFSFWPLYAGRFAVEGLGVLFWEMLALASLGLFLRYSHKMKRGSIIFLGLINGLGFYVHLHWILVALMVTLAVFHHLQNTDIPRKRETLFFFFLPMFFSIIPLLIAILKSEYGFYLHYLFALGDYSEKSFRNYFYTAGSYITALFWGVQLDYFAFKPFWGGFLNPILGSLFFMGLPELFKNRHQSINRWILLAFGVFLIPALLTKDVETFRIIQILPLLLVTTALGLQFLLLHLSGKNSRIIFLTGLFLCSLSLDLNHLTGPYAKFWPSHPEQWVNNYKSFRFWKTFKILEQTGVPLDPGAILFESSLDPHDQSLLTATYSFNSAYNSTISLDRIKWVAFFETDDLKNELNKLFPNSHLYPLDTIPEDLFFGLQWVHGISLRVIKVNQDNLATLTRWIHADRNLEQASLEELRLPNDQSRLKIMQDLLSHYPAFKGDPFLEMLFYERLATYAEMDRDNVLALRFTQEAVSRGLPRASAYHRLGVLWVKAHEYVKARKALLQAGSLNPLFKPQPGLLQLLLAETNK